MSLRGFHIVFITLATLLCAFLAVWAFFMAPAAETGRAATVLGVIGIAGTALLPVYGVYFYRKASKLVL